MHSWHRVVDESGLAMTSSTRARARTIRNGALSSNISAVRRRCHPDSGSCRRQTVAQPAAVRQVCSTCRPAGLGRYVGSDYLIPPNAIGRRPERRSNDGQTILKIA